MVKVGLIGAGEIAQLSHLPMLRNLPGMYEVVGITDVSEKMCREVQKKFNIPTVFKSPEELIASPEVEAVLVLTSDPFHCTYVCMALEAGKHVLVEKPVAMNTADVHKMMEAEKKAPGKVAMVGYMRRYASPFLKAKELLQNDARPIQYIRFRDIIREGDFYIRQSNHTVNAGQFDDLPEGGAQKLDEMKREQHSVALGEEATELQRNAYQMLLGLGCHSFSAVRELVGQPKEVVKVLTAQNGTHMVALLQYDGFIGTYEMVNDQEIVQFDAAIEIFQGNRLLKIKYETPYIRFLPHTLEVIESDGKETKTTVYGPDYHDAFETELREFYRCIAEGAAPKTTFADALADIEMYQQMAKMVQKEG